MVLQPYNSKMGLAGFVAWLTTLFVMVMGFRRLKEVIEYLLMKLYEIFIQRNVINI